MGNEMSISEGTEKQLEIVEMWVFGASISKSVLKPALELSLLLQILRKNNLVFCFFGVTFVVTLFVTQV